MIIEDLSHTVPSPTRYFNELLARPCGGKWWCCNVHGIEVYRSVTLGPGIDYWASTSLPPTVSLQHNLYTSFVPLFHPTPPQLPHYHISFHLHYVIKQVLHASPLSNSTTTYYHTSFHLHSLYSCPSSLFFIPLHLSTPPPFSPFLTLFLHFSLQISLVFLQSTCLAHFERLFD